MVLVVEMSEWILLLCCVFFQAEDGIRDLVRSRGLGDVYKRQFRRFVCNVCVELFLTRLFLVFFDLSFA